MGAPTGRDDGAGAPEPSQGDEPDWDARWRELTESLGDLEPAEAPTAEPDEPEVAASASERSLVAGEPSDRADLGGPRDYSPAEEDDSFDPGDPGPVAGDPVTTAGWCALAGGPFALVLVLVFWRNAPGAVVGACIAAFLAGAVVLLWRMPARRSDSDDDGAVV